jgi:hypothetical protein
MLTPCSSLPSVCPLRWPNSPRRFPSR